MKKTMFAVLVLGAVAAADAQVNFDRGVDAKSFAGQAVSAAPALPQAPQSPAAAGQFERCRLSFDMGRTCEYRCADGKTFTNFNPFPPVTPNQWVGPIYTPCPAYALNPFPAAKGGNMWQVLPKIKLNDRQPDMNGTLVGLVARSAMIDAVVRDLNGAGFKVKPFQDNQGGYLVMAEVTPQEASDRAIGLARYYYITQVLVGERVYRDIFPKN